MKKPYPIRLIPAYQNYVWGGDRIRSYFHRDIEPGRYAESWEVSDREEGLSKIANGSWKGMPLKQLLEEEKDAILGKHKDLKPFPLLVKIIDAKETLSLQVHPDEEMARKFGGESKSEIWIALEKSTIYAGLHPGVTQSQFSEALEEGNIEPLLNKMVLEKGEAIYIPAGQIHAICAGSFLLEIQQNSNTTYRLYDWGRKGRQLHLEEGISSMHFETPPPHKLQSTPSQVDGHHRFDCLITNDQFIVECLEIRDRWQIKHNSKSFQILFCLEGNANFEDEPVSPGDCFLIPARLTQMSIYGSCRLISVRLP